MPSTSPFKTVQRACLDNNQQPQELETDPLSLVASDGIVLGTGLRATFKLRPDSEADAAHGTLERTSGLGVWVYSDHSSEGTTVNDVLMVHQDAVVVHQGDTLKLGQQVIKLCLEMGTIETASEEEDAVEEKEQVSPISTNQEMELGTTRVARLARRRASTPWEFTGAFKTKGSTHHLQIDTSGLKPHSLATIQPIRTRDHAATQWRQKRATSPKTLGHSQSFHRSRTRFVLGIDMPQPEEAVEKSGHPPPMEYSSSPIVSPSSMMTRKRHTLFQPSKALPVPIASHRNPEMPPPPFVRVTARRDDLRIQVSKKMAAAAPMSAGKTPAPCMMSKAVEFQAPASPVAQKDIKKQQESLQTILQHKYNEEQLLKQQQEEWMRAILVSNASSIPLPCEREEKLRGDFDSAELTYFAVKAPVLLRTISLGISDEQPSPRLCAAIRASRTRLNSFDEAFGGHKDQDLKGRRKTTALILTPSIFHQDASESSSFDKESEVRSLNESVSSTATTVITRHRRITSSLVSDSASSMDLCEFMGYEEEVEDMVTSYTTTEVYGSDELRDSRKDTPQLLDSNRINRDSLYGTLSPPLSSFSCGISPLNTADTRLGSPRRCRPKTPETFNLSGTDMGKDCQDSSLSKNPDDSRVWSLRDSHFDPHSPFKSTAFSKNGQHPQFRKFRRPASEPEDVDGNSMGGSEVRQSRPLSFRRRASFRHHALKPLTSTSKT